jgi:histone H3/H4
VSTVVKSAVRAQIKKAGMRVAGDFWNALDAKVRDHVKLAAEKAKADGRKTVRAADLE